MSTRVMKEEAGVPDAAPAEEPAVVFTAEERRVLREVLKRVSAVADGQLIEVPGERPLDESYYFTPMAVRIMRGAGRRARRLGRTPSPGGVDVAAAAGRGVCDGIGIRPARVTSSRFRSSTHDTRPA